MGMLTKYGTIWGHIPQLGGRIFFVGPGSSSASTVTIDGRTFPMSDGNDGLSPERPLSTITQAITNATANVGDVICLLPGTHNASTQTGQTASGALAMNKAGLTFVGLPLDPFKPYMQQTPQAIITAPSGTVPVAVSAADNVFINLGFLGVSGQKTMTYVTAANRLTVRGCYFDLTVGAASTAGLVGTGATQAPANMLVEDSFFATDNTGTSGSFALDMSAAVDFLVRFNVFRFNAQGSGVAAHTTMIKCNAGSAGTFDRNDIVAQVSGTATITNGISGAALTANGQLHLFGNRVSAVVTNPFTGFSASNCDLLNNYIGTVAGGSGGTLITSTT